LVAKKGSTRQHHFLHLVHDVIGVVAIVYLEGGVNAIAVEDAVQLAIASSQTTLVAHVVADVEGLEAVEVLKA
jgi:hypothetical protein